MKAERGADMLIGMDMIMEGAMCITKKNGR